MAFSILGATIATNLLVDEFEEGDFDKFRKDVWQILKIKNNGQFFKKFLILFSENSVNFNTVAEATSMMNKIHDSALKILNEFQQNTHESNHNNNNQCFNCLSNDMIEKIGTYLKRSDCINYGRINRQIYCQTQKISFIVKRRTYRNNNKWHNACFKDEFNITPKMLKYLANMKFNSCMIGYNHLLSPYLRFKFVNARHSRFNCVDYENDLRLIMANDKTKKFFKSLFTFELQGVTIGAGCDCVFRYLPMDILFNEKKEYNSMMQLVFDCTRYNGAHAIAGMGDPSPMSKMKDNNCNDKKIFVGFLDNLSILLPLYAKFTGYDTTILDILKYFRGKFAHFKLFGNLVHFSKGYRMSVDCVDCIFHKNITSVQLNPAYLPLNALHSQLDRACESADDNDPEKSNCEVNFYPHCPKLKTLGISLRNLYRDYGYFNYVVKFMNLLYKAKISHQIQHLMFCNIDRKEFLEQLIIDKKLQEWMFGNGNCNCNCNCNYSDQHPSSWNNSGSGMNMDVNSSIGYFNNLKTLKFQLIEDYSLKNSMCIINHLTKLQNQSFNEKNNQDSCVLLLDLESIEIEWVLRNREMNMGRNQPLTFKPLNFCKHVEHSKDENRKDIDMPPQFNKEFRTDLSQESTDGIILELKKWMPTLVETFNQDITQYGGTFRASMKMILIKKNM